MSRRSRSGITRRDFMRGATYGVVGATIGIGVASQTGAEEEAKPKEKTATVWVVRDKDAVGEGNSIRYEVVNKMLATLMQSVAGVGATAEAWRKFLKPEDKTALVPTRHLNRTSPEVIQAVEEQIKAAGLPAPGSLLGKGKDAPAEFTALISLPGLKAHWLTGIGTVLKGYIMFSGKPSAYHDADSKKLGEIWLLPTVKDKTRLIIVDALVGLYDKGPQPQPKDRWPYCGLIAGTDPVAVEAVAVKIIQGKRNAVKGAPWPLSPPPLCLAEADMTYHLGTSDLARIDIRLVGWGEESFLG